ncbi:RagB/SusD family nutrient uptake outer membrane protein [Hymenobacter sp. BT664]|uniref:RagB/SusD family nutrient uptake outer membrane protein n=1 Tax=Hymenobacter montanus TaxID=2771359 RepID=A0A927BBU5_9BACT|nr:RagB/SusD family nutrient uptake outer membrane protein [Hymenobacter montanus]MBD2767264.1 RagB/SusD family nutrient uptake outer membrane protein [Hymenobacter montanus]
MTKKKRVGTAAILALLPLLNSCSLNEEFKGNLTSDQVVAGSPDALLVGVYNTLRDPIQGCQSVYALEEVSTDEVIMPTRGPDWDDNGKWRALHLHTWDANNDRVRDTFSQLNYVVFAATDILRYNPSIQQQAEARFLRAWAMFWELDLYDQVPYRDPGESVADPSRVRRGTEALAYIISEIQAVQPDLPAGPAGKANKDAARALLMKCYLNKGAYANRKAPTFDAADMNQVIRLADELINSGRYTFTDNYFDNFAPNNTAIGKENIFTQENSYGNAGAVRDYWKFVLHYNLVPVNGYNGPATTPVTYDRYEATDKRRGSAYRANSPNATNPGNRTNVGYFAGQQYSFKDDAPLQDRSGAPLIFTKDINIIETGRDLEVKGIRPLKYPVDYASEERGGNGGADNDHVSFRLADVLLMKAEAILRGGTATSAGSYGSTPLDLVNAIRTHPSRGASALTSLSLDELLDERGRELYNEEWRRQDLIRFGKFLLPRASKPQSADKYLLFPIPQTQVDVNPNLAQNPGY